MGAISSPAHWNLASLPRALSDTDVDRLLASFTSALPSQKRGYHRFRRSVSYANGGKFRVKTEAEQQIWNDCAR